MSIHSDRRYGFDASADDVWSALTRVDEYQHWWPWLVEFDGTDFVPGSRWHCTVRTPLRYEVHFVVELVEVDAERRVAANVTGDISGAAELNVLAVDQGSELRLVSDLSSRKGIVATVDRFVPRLAEASHGWVLDSGLRQFRDGNGFVLRGNSS